MSHAAPVRVLVVDDTPDIRMVIALALELDGRYEVVGEAGDGVEGIAAAEALQPDVVLLDRSMPRLDGLTALPEIRTVAPSALVILYTSESDARIHQAAVAAGAIDVLTKDAKISRIGEVVADVLTRTASITRTDFTVRVGPVSSASALAWIDNTADILRAVRADPDATDVPIADEVFATFLHYLEIWRDVAEADAEFSWTARASTAEVEHLIGAWASIDRIDDDRLRALGCEWSTPLGRSFFEEITGAIMDALAMQETTSALARRLESQWAPRPRSSTTGIGTTMSSAAAPARE